VIATFGNTFLTLSVPQQPVFEHRRSTSFASTRSRSRIEESFLSDDSNDYDGNPESIQIIIARGSRYPALRRQPPRVAAVVRRAFGVSELKIISETAYPPLDDSAGFFRATLREAAIELDDDEIAYKIKTDALYGNALGYLARTLASLCVQFLKPRIAGQGSVYSPSARNSQSGNHRSSGRISIEGRCDYRSESPRFAPR
jgi:hypothetical protein